jgi:hypothetical protein
VTCWRVGRVGPDSTGYYPDVSRRGDKVFGVVAIVLGVAMIVAAAVDVLVTPWVVIGASLLGIIWLAVVKRRPPQKVYRTTR